MKIFQLRTEAAFEWLFPTRNDGYDEFDLFDGSGPITNWIPLVVEPDDPSNQEGKPRRRNSKYKPVTETDFPHLSAGVPCFSGRAWDLLRPLIASHVQTLPLICNDGEFWAINVLTVLPDAFDWDHANYERYESTSQRIWLDRVVFKKTTRSWPAIFKIGNPVDTVRVYVSNEFKCAVERMKLIGAAFHPIEVSENS